MLTRRTALAGFACAALRGETTAETWQLTNVARVGGHTAHVEGNPRAIDRAIAFDGAHDAIFLDVHPLAGAHEFTWEVVFRPAADGSPAQRFFHLQENGSENRMLFETRLTAGGWSLDSYVKCDGSSATLLDLKRLHTVDEWHHAAAVCDGRELRNYVDGELLGQAPLAFVPHRQGRTSLGVRINRVDYFKGSIRTARMTKAVLAPREFLSRSS